MERKELYALLQRWNPWWLEQESSPSVPETRRDTLEKLIGDLTNQKITSLLGPRQSGKTTLLKQAIRFLIQSKSIPTRHILYLPLDAFQEKPSPLRDIVECFENENLDSRADRRILFLDEIHEHAAWSREIKVLFDEGLPRKFVITGSSSSDVSRGSAESLAGRLLPIHLFPLTFSETLRFRLGADLDRTSFPQRLKPLPEAFHQALAEGRGEDFFAACGAIQQDLENGSLLPFADRLRSILQEQLLHGGYPEIASRFLGPEEIARNLRAYLDAVMHKDFIRFFHIREPLTMENLLLALSKTTSCIQSERNLAKNLGSAINTVRSYLAFLKLAFLVDSTRAFEKNAASQLRQPRKYYVLDAGIRNTLVGYAESDAGYLLESLAFMHLKKLAAESSIRTDIFYWRDKMKGLEVDMILQSGKSLLPIEIKHGQPAHLAGLHSFVSAFPSWGLVVSNNLARMGNVYSIPPHIFLLIP